MKKYTKVVLIVLLLIPLITIAAQTKSIKVIDIAQLEKNISEKKQKQVKESVKIETKKLSHRQIVWRNALEWCESNGNKDAINPQDADNTPSYYSFQWKPGTFKSYAIKYGVIPANTTDEKAFELMKDYTLQVKVVDNMILDTTIKWNIQFPGCIKKIGNPPRS